VACSRLNFTFTFTLLGGTREREEQDDGSIPKIYYMLYFFSNLIHFYFLFFTFAVCNTRRIQSAFCFSIIHSFLFLFQLDTLLFSFFFLLFTFTIFLYMFRTGWSIIRRIKCLIPRAASGTVPCNMSFSNYRGYLVCCIAFVYNSKNSCYRERCQRLHV